VALGKNGARRKKSLRWPDEYVIIFWYFSLLVPPAGLMRRRRWPGKHESDSPLPVSPGMNV
jgi:hypothetical protein